MQGRYCRVEPIDERFAADLHAANLRDADGRTWTYLPYGPFASEADYRRWMTATCLESDPLFHTSSTMRRRVRLASARICGSRPPQERSKSGMSITRRCSNARAERPKRCT